MNKINEIIQIITDCETVQASYESDYTKEMAKMHAYDAIREVIGTVKEQEE